MTIRRRIASLLAATAALSVSAALLAAQSDAGAKAPRVTAIRAGRLFDGKSTSLSRRIRSS